MTINPLFILRFIGKMVRNGKQTVNNNYPRPVDLANTDSLTGGYKWALCPAYVGQVGGSKYRAYRQARNRVCYTRHYGRNPMPYLPFRGFPVGILP